MGQYSITKGGSIDIDLATDLKDNGWTVEDGYAVHHACNQGDIGLMGFPYIPGIQNKFRYIVEGFSSGIVKLNVGAQSGQISVSNGEKLDLITPAVNDTISFYSDGNLKIKLLSISAVTDQGAGVTFTFDEKSKIWTTHYDYRPEFMVKFSNKLYACQNGQIWLQNSNPIRNNFFGVQYKSKVVFYVNIQPKTIKDFFSVFVNSNKPWAITSAYIFPTEGKSQGMKSRIKKNDFTNIMGGWYADFKRNMLDPRFLTQLDALFNGAELQGNIMEITMENDDTTEVRLISVDVETAIQNFTH